jgi:hypothetical protein
MAFTLLQQDSFVSTSAAVRIPLPGSADYFVTNNVTQAATTNATGRGVRFDWYKNVTAEDAAIEWKKTNSTDALNMVGITSGGFTYVTTYPNVGAQSANAITGITAASPAVVTQTNTYSDGDIIRLYSTTGMLQIAGMDFQISSSSGSGYTLLGLRAAGFAAPGTAGYTRRISRYSAVLPETLYITEITQATSAVVRTSIDPTLVYVVGMKVHFSVPYSFGMTQINGLTGKITALSSANYTMTVDIDSSAFTAFAFPASSASPTAQLFATVAPAGVSTQYNPNTGVQTGYDFTVQPFRTSQFVPYMFLAAGAQSPAGSTGDTIVWQAWKKEN